jgi:hypothetical protein
MQIEQLSKSGRIEDRRGGSSGLVPRIATAGHRRWRGEAIHRSDASPAHRRPSGRCKALSQRPREAAAARQGLIGYIARTCFTNSVHSECRPTLINRIRKDNSTATNF